MAVLLDLDGPICTLFGPRSAARVTAELLALVPLPGLDHSGPLDVLRAATRLAPHHTAEIEAALRAARWEPAGEWTITGPLDLFDSALRGTERKHAPRLTIDIEAGHYHVRAAAMVIVQLVPAGA